MGKRKGKVVRRTERSAMKVTRGRRQQQAGRPPCESRQEACNGLPLPRGRLKEVDMQERRTKGSLAAAEEAIVHSPTERRSLQPETSDIKTARHPRHEFSHFTKGPIRFTIANDGTRDCTALLVPKTFVDRLADLFEQKIDLSAMEDQMYHARTHIRHLENSLHNFQNSLEAADTQELAEDLRRLTRQQEYELHKAHRDKQRLEKEYELVRNKQIYSKNQTQHMLEIAMEAAGLLRPPKSAVSTKIINKENRGDKTDENAAFERRESFDSYTSSEIATGPEEAGLQALFAKVNESWYYFEQAQAQFDDRKHHYYQNLTEYERGVVNGQYTFSRSEFDHRAIEYERQLTGALIDAEAAYDQAQEEARARYLTGSATGPSSWYGSDLSVPETVISHGSTREWGPIDTWMVTVQDSHADKESLEAVELDDWDAGTVNISDSLSAIDYEQYNKQIMRWQDSCASLRDQWGVCRPVE